MKWTLITGAAKNLGAALVMELAKTRPVLIHYHKSEEAARRLKDKIGRTAEIVQGDFSTPESTEDFILRVQSMGCIKGLVNNVGNYLIGSYLDKKVEDLRLLMQTNFFTPYMLVHAFKKDLIQEKGTIINLGMSGLRIKGETRLPLYNLTKTALLMMTKCLAKELADKGVRVNMVSPGYLESSIDLPESPERIPMKRFASLEEVAKTVAFLLEEKNSYLTGQNLEVAGGVGL